MNVLLVAHALCHVEPRLAAIAVHTDPGGHSGDDPHQRTAHHERLAGSAEGPVKPRLFGTGKEPAQTHADGPQ